MTSYKTTAGVMSALLFGCLVTIVLGMGGANSTTGDPSQLALPDGFYLQSKTAVEASENRDRAFRTVWRRASKEETLRAVKTERLVVKGSVADSLRETWLRDADKGMVVYEKFECPDRDTLEKVIDLQNKVCATVLVETDKPLVGDKTWVPKYANPDSVFIMGTKDLTLVIAYVTSRFETKEKLAELATNLLEQ